MLPMWFSQAQHREWNCSPMQMRLDLFQLSRAPQHCLIIGGGTTQQGPLLEIIADFCGTDPDWAKRKSQVQARYNDNPQQWQEYLEFKKTVIVVNDMAWEEFAQMCIAKHSIINPVNVHMTPDDCELLNHSLFQRSAQVVSIIVHLLNDAPGIQLTIFLRCERMGFVLISMMCAIIDAYNSTMLARVNVVSKSKIGLIANHRRMTYVDDDGKTYYCFKNSPRAKEMCALPDTSLLQIVTSSHATKYSGKYDLFREYRDAAYK